MSLYNSINEYLTNVASRNAKIVNLSELIYSEKYCYEVFALALNPLITFGFGSVNIPEQNKPGKEIDSIAINGIEYLSHQNHSNASIEYLSELLKEYDHDNQILIKNIILKDLRCGVQLSSFNKAIEMCNKNHGTKFETINDYPCMLVSAYSEKIFNKIFSTPESYAYCQLKCDGMRFNAIIENNTVKFFGRSGKEIYITNQDFINQFIELASHSNVVFDGELLIDGDSTGHAADRKIGNGILNKAVKNTISEKEQQRITAIVWDRIPLINFKQNHYDLPYKIRYAALTEDFKSSNPTRISIVPTKIVHNKQECTEMFEQMLSEHLEGVIVKSPDNVWKDVRATDQVKLKAELDLDVRVLEFETGTGRFEGMLGALVCGTDDGNIQFKVGTGFTEQQRKEIKPTDIVGKIITVTYNARIKDKNRPDVDSLFLPRFVEIREDKDVTNTSEQCK